jgi:fluoride exporter
VDDERALRDLPQMTPLALQIGLVAMCGFVGGVARVWLAARIAARLGERFPFGTLAVNVSGAALIGVLAGLVPPDEPLWLALAVGLLGSYTTVSSFSLQTLSLLRGGAPGLALANVLASTLLCLLAAAAGYVLAVAIAGALA